MAEEALGKAAEPDGAPRIATLDVMRGIAILGILFMNINDMGRSLWASFEDFKSLGWSTGDQIAWWLREVLANGTARCMLEMLFGVGMVILTDRFSRGMGDAEVPLGRFRRIMGRVFGPGVVLRRYYLRNLVLFLFGLVHIFILLWPGDILHTYGLAAMVAFLFRRLRPRWLLTIGLIMAVLQLGGQGGTLYFSMLPKFEAQNAAIAKQKAGQPLTAAEKKLVADRAKRDKERAKSKAEDQQKIAAENKARSPETGTFSSWALFQQNLILFFWGFNGGFFLEWAWVWEAASTMLIGAALFKMGIIQGSRSRGFYVKLLVIGYGIGVAMRTAGAWHDAYGVPGPNMGWNHQEFGRLAMTLGHIAAINLLLKSVGGAKLLKPFEAAGRTALSVYIAQTMICLWVLYPPFMLGLYGKQTWSTLMLTALAINAVLLWLANIYVRHYAIAPVEWAWRSIISGRRLPIRRGTAADVPVGAPLPA